MSGFERVGRGKAWWLGEYVTVKCDRWEGPIESGREGKTISDLVVFPVNQSHHAMHPRHPTGFCGKTGRCLGSFSPSLSYYGDLCRYANFRWK